MHKLVGILVFYYSINASGESQASLRFKVQDSEAEGHSIEHFRGYIKAFKSHIKGFYILSG